MSAVTTPAEAHAAVDLDGPALAHIAPVHEHRIALCGAGLIGIDPPSNWPVCERCLEIAKEWER